MQVEIFTLCSSVRPDGDNIHLMGQFDEVTTNGFPAPVSFCVLSKIRFERGEDGKHRIEFTLMDSDMRAVIFQGIKTKDINEIRINLSNRKTAVHCSLWIVQGMPIPKTGDFYIELRVDGVAQGRIPLFVVLKT